MLEQHLSGGAEGGLGEPDSSGGGATTSSGGGRQPSPVNSCGSCGGNGLTLLQRSSSSRSSDASFASNSVMSRSASTQGGGARGGAALNGGGSGSSIYDLSTAKHYVHRRNTILRPMPLAAMQLPSMGVRHPCDSAIRLPDPLQSVPVCLAALTISPKLITSPIGCRV